MIFQFSTGFELRHQLQERKAFGITLPATLLGRADEVIE
jgi:hypothetical protein